MKDFLDWATDTLLPILMAVGIALMVALPCLEQAGKLPMWIEQIIDALPRF